VCRWSWGGIPELRRRCRPQPRGHHGEPRRESVISRLQPAPCRTGAKCTPTPVWVTLCLVNQALYALSEPVTVCPWNE